PAIQLTAQDEQLTLILPGNWLDEHPLGREMVDQECQWQSYVHWILRVASGDTLK
ncbi:guanosine-5'-triphosphate,3'-diphosphate pyrophosphatase, partial [Klebsiella pneumoniae]|nr:guanosine-5'-triphosphate,3'-diphosphate pyrophosphatase [Klebsiella pneumoniae]